MRKRERLERALAGESTDRIPVALWRHWPGDDQRSADLARSIIDFQHDYNWDFVRIMPSQTFQVVDYGVADEWNGNQQGFRDITKHIVKRSLDWTELRSLSPDRGALGTQVACIRLVNEAMRSDEVPILVTIYSPFTQASQLGGKDLLLRNMRTHADRVRTGLNIITESTLRFIEALRRFEHVAGIFFVTEFATYDAMSEAEYDAFITPYNLKILESLPDRWWFNVAQVKGISPMLKLFANLPVQSINWDTREGHPDLSRAKSLFAQASIGGLSDASDLHTGTPSTIQMAIREAINQTEGRRLILASGGSGYITTPTSNIRAVRQQVESMAL